MNLSSSFAGETPQHRATPEHADTLKRHDGEGDMWALVGQVTSPGTGGR